MITITLVYIVIKYGYDYLAFWTNVIEYEYDYSESMSTITTSTITPSLTVVPSVL